MKQIEGKARVRQKYGRMFFWWVPIGSLFLVYLGVAAVSWDYRALFMLLPGILIGGALGVLLRDLP